MTFDKPIARPRLVQPLSFVNLHEPQCKFCLFIVNRFGSPWYCRVCVCRMKSMVKMIKTRLCVISDTHTNTPMFESSTEFAYREPLPKADVLLHAGDLTMTGLVSEYQITLDVLKKAEAELKIVIAGNHDITLDESFYNECGSWMFHEGKPENLSKVREMWTGWDAKQAGIIYLEEGTRTFILKNGATLTVGEMLFILYRICLSYGLCFSWMLS